MFGGLAAVGMRSVSMHGRSTVVISLRAGMRGTSVSQREGICRHEAHQKNKYGREPELEN